MDIKNALRSTLFGTLILHSALLFADTWDERHQNQQTLLLSKVRDCEVFSDYSMTCKDVIKEKIQSAEALKNGFGEMQRWYDPKSERLTIRGTFISSDGTQISHKKFQDNPETGEDAVYNDLHVVTLTMPELSVGGVMETVMNYRLHTPKLKGHFSATYSLDPEEKPAKYVRYSLTLPDGMDLTIVTRNGLSSPKESKKNGKRYLEWVLENADGISNESYMPSYDHLAKSVAITNWKNWADLDRTFKPLMEKASALTPTLTALSGEITKGATSTEDKIQRIFNYIDDNIRYVSMNLGQNGLTPHLAEETLKNKYGDCKDRTALAIALLRTIGVKAYPCLVASKTAAIEKEAPTWTYFNHMISAVEFDGHHYVESTDGGYPFKERHPGLDGRQVFEVNGQGGIWANIPQAQVSLPDPNIRREIWLKEDGSGKLIENQIVLRKSLSETRQSLREINSKSKKERDLKSQQVLAGYLPGIQKGALTFGNLENRFGPLSLKVEGIIPDMAEASAPFLIFDLAPTDLRSEFPDTPREYDLWFTEASHKKQEWIVHLPKGFKVMHKPKNIRLNSEFKKYSRVCSLAEDILKVVEESVDIPIHISSIQYPRVRKFIETLTEASEDKLILQRAK